GDSYLIDTPYFVRSTGRAYGLSRDGQRFLMVKEGDGGNTQPASMIVVASSQSPPKMPRQLVCISASEIPLRRRQHEPVRHAATMAKRGLTVQVFPRQPSHLIECEHDIAESPSRNG